MMKEVGFSSSIPFYESAKSREQCRLCVWRRRLRGGSRGLLAYSEAKLLRSRV